jgi:hypothetical protein
MFGKTYNNCVKKEEVEIVDEAMSSYDRNRKAAAKRAAERNRLRRAGKMGGRMENETYRNEAGTTMHHKGYKVEEVELEGYSANPAQQAAIAIAKKKKKEDDMVAKKKKQKMYAGYEPEGELVDENILKDVGKKIIDFIKKPIIAPTVTKDKFKKRVDDKTTNQLVEPVTQKNSYDPEGETISEVKDKKGKGSGKKDACYHKVKSRYSVWPSAYASGALVKCRKVGAANWGNSSKKEDFSDWKSEFIWEDGDSSKKIEEDWQKTNRQDKTDGMSQKAVNAYRKENPGSKLKTAVTKKPSSLKRGSKDAKRRKSFCSRMKGMKKRLTSAKTARDPDSRINKALRRWNC